MRLSKGARWPFFLLACIVGFYAHIFMAGQPGCEVTILSRSRSPDAVWEAVLKRSVCSDGAFTTTVTKIVELTHHEASLDGDKVVFSVEDDGQEERGPVLSWKGKRLLEIELYGGRGELVASKYADVTVDVKSAQ